MSSSDQPPKANRKTRRARNIRLIQSREESRDGKESYEIRVYTGRDSSGRKQHASSAKRHGLFP